MQILCLLLVCLCLPARATSIVILRSPDRIYIGADSRRTYRDPAATFEGTVCKIVPAGPFYFLASGLTYANDEQVADIGADAGRNAHSIKGAVELLRRRMQEFLPAALAAEKQIERGDADVGRSLVLETAFAGVENGSTFVSMQLYRKSGGDGRVRMESHAYSSSTPGRYDFIFLGKRRAIDDRLAGRFPDIRSDRDAVAFITQMVDLEIAESPESTAGPIDIVRLDGSGAHWLQQKAACGGEGQR
ncbi:MAG TPA: hypothetical protein VHU83_00935 [Bryobacteraceae bacterium]|nr:hypothetical protein [Bryobacteraceae bacterium]